ncbi:MAG: phosphate/phosphite/phosphonate ABC transporter substrate-binding protein [Gammaproteobacteria bacterium]|nr:phosphate/phosphite/phosphonate ABC transporter substrate-binding protein [Gammaproteobacteria bacterium]
MHFRIAVFLVTMSVAVVASTAHGTEPRELRFGSVAAYIPAEMHRRLDPLANYLSETLKMPVSTQLSPNLSKAVEEISAGNVDLAYLTPVAYIRAHDQGRVRLVAKTITYGQPYFQLVIVVRADSGIATVEDLKGKSFAFGDKAALLQRAVVMGAGLPLDQLQEYKFLNHYENVVRGVLSGDFDAGIVLDSTAMNWQEKGLRVIHTSPELPPYSIVVSSRVDDELFDRIQKALLALDVNRPDHRLIIKTLSEGCDGYTPASDSDYNVVRKLIKPFEKEIN